MPLDMNTATSHLSADHFDAQATGWDEDPLKVLVATTIVKAMLAVLDLSQDDIVLDYGSGTGLGSLELAGKAGRVIAAEPSEGMHSVLCAKLVARGVQNVYPVRWSTHDSTLLPFSPTVITGSMVLHHVEDVPQAAQVFAEVLQSGGRIAFADLDYEGGAFHGPDQPAFHSGFHRETLLQIFKRAGFTNITFSEVMQVRKPIAGGGLGAFPVFLMAGRKV